MLRSNKQGNPSFKQLNKQLNSSSFDFQFCDILRIMIKKKNSASLNSCNLFMQALALAIALLKFTGVSREGILKPKQSVESTVLMNVRCTQLDYGHMLFAW